jgi:putative ABC transport system permease protein
LEKHKSGNRFIMVILKIIRESFLLAFQELMNNKLRSLLSLVGVTIGIFCIISVFASVDSLENEIQSTIQKMGDNVIYIEKLPWNFSADLPWWKYIQRPEANYKDYKAVKKHTDRAKAVAAQMVIVNKLVQYESNYRENVMLAGVTHDFRDIYDLDFLSGRYYTLKESETGDNLAIIGYKVADDLFPFPEFAIGKEVKLMGRKVKIIGVLAKEGESLLGSGLDDALFLPYSFTQKIVNENSRVLAQRVIVKAKDGVTLDELKAELTKIIRNVRRLRPKDEDNFALNQMSILAQTIEQTFGAINIAGLLIGGFSILVGGFGIANIMFVSVKERTRLIGIKLSLGAKRVFILLEFLIESVVLCLIGGIIGLGLVYLMFTAINQAISFSLVISSNNIMLGLSISIFIGVVSGIFPASAASRLDPVVAMRK